MGELSRYYACAEVSDMKLVPTRGRGENLDGFPPVDFWNLFFAEKVPAGGKQAKESDKIKQNEKNMTGLYFSALNATP